MEQSTFGSYVRRLRLQNGMTQAALAEKMHVTDKAVSKWERDLSYPDISLFPKLADQLGVTVDDLLRESADKAHISRLKQIFKMTHDIRTPLHIILGCVNLAQAHRNDPKLQQRYLNSIRVSGEYLLDVIDRIIQTTYREQSALSAREGDHGQEKLQRYLEEQQTDRRENREAFRFPGKRILVAEDIELNREIVHEIMKQAGAETEFAENGQICVEMVEAAPAGYYDMILMDILMPVLDGIEATRRIRQLSDRRKAEIPIIALTANVYDEGRDAAKEAGMNDFTEKPIFIEKLLATMQQYL